MSIVGWYYLHTNGELIYKPDPEAAADIRDSDFARGMWPIATKDRAGAWSLLVEACAAGANTARVAELATKWGCDDADAEIYAVRVGCILKRDGAAWCAHRADFENLQASPAGFGDTALAAMADLCRSLGYTPSKMWGSCFQDVLSQDLAAGSSA